MSDVFYREPDRCLHRNLDVRSGVCQECGSQLRWVVPVEIDEMTDQGKVFSIARHAAKRYLELCGQGCGAWGSVTDFLDTECLKGVEG